MPERSEYPRTCRLCGGRGWRHDLLKYGTRNYAHFRCFIEQKTIKDLDALPEYEKRALRAYMARQA